MTSVLLDADPKQIRSSTQPKDRLRMTVGEDRSYPTVKPAWSAPLSYPDTYLALLDGKGEEIITLEDPKELPSDSLDAVFEEIRRRYLTATVVSIKTAKQEFGATYWHLITDRWAKRYGYTKTCRKMPSGCPTSICCCLMSMATASKFQILMS